MYLKKIMNNDSLNEKSLIYYERNATNPRIDDLTRGHKGISWIFQYIRTMTFVLGMAFEF
jgi:hypothetical protein